MPRFVTYVVELKMRRIRRFVPTAVLIVALGQAGRAEAGVLLRLTDTADAVSVTIADNGVGDANPLVGAVTYIGAVGEFGLNVTTGISRPILGGGVLPDMDLNSVEVKFSGTKADTLTIMLTDTGWNPTLTPTLLTQEVGGTKAGSIGAVTFNSFIDPANGAFGT